MKHSYVYRTVRDESNYDREVFANLLIASDWTTFDATNDLEEMWNLLYMKPRDILSIMCPFKKYKQREIMTLWTTAEIYHAMRQCDSCTTTSLFRVTGCQLYLQLARSGRNQVNQMISTAKSTYILIRIDHSDFHAAIHT